MKGIFSKAGGSKKELSSGKLDRRSIVPVPMGVNGNANVNGGHFTTQPGLLSASSSSSSSNPNNNSNATSSRVSSFIPTASYHTNNNTNNSNSHTHMNGHAKPVPTNSLPIPHHQPHPHHFYSNLPSSTSIGAKQDNHHHSQLQYTNYQQSQQSSSQQHHRSLGKSYSSSNHPQNHNQSLYGNTSVVYANNNNTNVNGNYPHANANSNAFYGNTSTDGSGGYMMTNGHVVNNNHQQHHGRDNFVNEAHHQPQHQEPLITMHHGYNNNNEHGFHTQNTMQKMNAHHNQQQQQQQQQRIHVPQNYNNNNNGGGGGGSATEGLPATLVDSMRTLFDILDDSKQGKVRLSDIETRWECDTMSNNNNNNNPKGPSTSAAEPLIKMGVLEYLRKVTPSDGLLTFDRFCSALRLALITNGSSNGGDVVVEENPVVFVSGKFPEKFQKHHNSQMNHHQVPPHFISNEPMGNNNKSMMSPPKALVNHSHIAPPSHHPHQQTNNAMPSLPPPKAPNSSHQQQGQNNTMSRLSKIPNFSSSRLPMPNSNSNSANANNNAVSFAPSVKANTIPIVNNNSQMKAQHAMNMSNSLISGTKRYPQSSEQAQTIALVHSQPPPNSKPVYNGNNTNSSSPSKVIGGGTLRVANNTNKIPGSGFLNRFSSKNSSLDDLQIQSNNGLDTGSKDRPPSAPILDTEEESKAADSSHNYHSQSKLKSSSNNNRERAKSQERDRVMVMGAPTQTSTASRAEEKANFVKSRQRTLSMPQLQLNKLKPKSPPTGETRPSKQSAESNDSDSGNYPKPSNLKNHSLSKLLAAGHQYGSSSPSSSSIPTPKAGEDSKELPPPPPKPPRNNNSILSGPVTISTTLISGLTHHEPPLSGSSFESGGTSTLSGPTMSVGSIDSGNVPTNKPSEIRSVLSTWQKSVTEKKSAKESKSGIPSGPNANATTTNASTLPNGNNSSGSDEVKMRPVGKSSLKRKETARRHTVQSGIDFSTLKRLKQLEQERDVLQQGLQYLEKSNQWYLKQLEGVKEKIDLLSKGVPASDSSGESTEERLNLLGCRVTEVNSLLTALMDGSTQLPLHMDLQIPSHLSLRTITRLKDQNRQLTQEVSDLYVRIAELNDVNMSKRVTQLENEKALLLRQLFKNTNSPSTETVYM